VHQKQDRFDCLSRRRLNACYAFAFAMATAAEVAREQCGVVAVAGGQMTIAWSTRAQLGHNSLQLSFLKKKQFAATKYNLRHKFVVSVEVRNADKC
jgi:hypothetical protein